MNEAQLENPIYMEIKSEDNEIEFQDNENRAFASDKGENSGVVFSRETPFIRTESRMSTHHCCNAKKLKSRAATIDCELGSSEKVVLDKKLCRQDRIELGRLLQGAVSSHNWELAESLIIVADPQTLNDALCITLDSIWFLSTELELNGITVFIRKIIANGAYDFTRATLRTSFLASCVSACQSRTMSLVDTITVMAQRLHERLQECNGDEVLKAEAGAKVQKFTEWALKCIGIHSQLQDGGDNVIHSSAVETQLRLSAFKTFLDLVGNRLTGKDFSEAFDAACFPLTLFSSSFDPGWAFGMSAAVIQGLLGMLVEGGADNVNQCFLEASRFGSTELVRVLLQWLYGHMDRDQDRYSPDYELENGLGFFGSDEEVLTQIPTQAQSIVEGSGTVRVLEYQPYPDVDYLQELLAIQQQGPRAIGFFGTRNMGFMHQELIEILSYAMVITKNHIYTSGASGTNAAVIRGALRAEKPELLTVILPQSLSKQPPESQELLSKVKNVIEKPHNDHLPLLEASRLCNMDIISHVQQVICFAFHDSRLLMETCQEAKNLRKIVTLFYLD